MHPLVGNNFNDTAYFMSMLQAAKLTAVQILIEDYIARFNHTLLLKLRLATKKGDTFI